MIFFAGLFLGLILGVPLGILAAAIIVAGQQAE
jgi:hypothetical protein